MKQVIDNFSQVADKYVIFRPESTDSLYDFLFERCPCFETAWDCGTGNGQVAVKLAERFQQVYATDISAEQLSQAPKVENIVYKNERSEVSTLADDSIDFIACGQSIHWFDIDAFYNEAKRVGRSGALFAAWGYGNLRLTPEVNRVLNHFYRGITRKYLNKVRDHVDASYTSIHIPFEHIPTPEFSLNQQWTLEQLIGYLRTWSGAHNYIKIEHSDPYQIIKDDLIKAWGRADQLDVYWPVFLKAGYIWK